jgi:hypothetical protein
MPMLIEGLNFRQLTPVPLELLQPVIDGCNSFEWLTERLNQPGTSGALAGGKTLEFPFVSQHPATRFRPYLQSEIDLLNKAMPLLKWVTEYIGHPVILIRCEYATLLPKSQIKWHIDSNHKFFAHCQRIHIPVTTNLDCNQMWEKEVTRFEPGNIYEYNNQIKHCAANNGDSLRTTLILDLIKESEWQMFVNAGIFKQFSRPMGNLRELKL